MLTPFVLFAERLGSDKIGVDKRHFIGIFHCKINILRMSQRDFIVVGILQRDLIATEVRKDIITTIFPRTGSVEDIGKFVYQGGFTARFTTEDRHGTHKEWLHFRRNIFPVAERVFADLRTADTHKGTFRIDQHRLDPQMFHILWRIGFFRGVDQVRLNPFFSHKLFDAVAPYIPAVWIWLHALFIESMNTDIFLIFKGLQ